MNRKCLMCGNWFEAYDPRHHICSSCEGAADEHDEQADKKQDKKETGKEPNAL